MDVLEKLAEKNRRHNQQQRINRRKRFPKILVMTIAFAAWVSIFIFLNIDTYNPESFPFWGISKQIWLAAMILSIGTGLVFITYSCSFILWILWLAKRIVVRTLLLKISIIMFMSLGLGFLFIGFGFGFGLYLDHIIRDNISSITVFFEFGFDKTPRLIEVFLNFVISTASMFLVVIECLVVSAPFGERRKPFELLGSKASNDDNF
ncbi:hypothetical protein [Sessilibacter sp. MAH4]